MLYWRPMAMKEAISDAALVGTRQKIGDIDGALTCIDALLRDAGIVAVEQAA